MKIQVSFQKLLTLVKGLSPAQKKRLRQELNEEELSLEDKDDFIEYLLNGPIYSDKDISIIEENRQSIAAWRTAN